MSTRIHITFHSPNVMSVTDARDGMHVASRYMLLSFTSCLHSTTHGTAYHRPAKPDCVSDNFITESDSIIRQLVRAFLNPGMCVFQNYVLYLIASG